MESNYKSAEWYGEKHPEPDDLYKKKSINFGFEKVGLLQLKAGRGVTIATNSRMEMGEHNHGLCNRITKEQKW